MRLKLDMRSRENEKLLKISETMINAAQISQGGGSASSGMKFVARLVRMPSATTEIAAPVRTRLRRLNAMLHPSCSSKIEYN
ncbi:hypothetical protein EDS67_19385 [candidate division KSB1 bacterium]|nr:MAG: hypothetical protein EDS67_19385 [candidate division KSB1 bacterium]MBC6946828.1 hypothetical protein [candidate division KSB1 bacterium]MCE7942737.1 hypothetical protein [Chlorobi bacterium CHB1]MDL1876805.1 hypothetical protein [Cytophagia bacterium CHB2]